MRMINITTHFQCEDILPDKGSAMASQKAVEVQETMYYVPWSLGRSGYVPLIRYYGACRRARSLLRARRTRGASDRTARRNCRNVGICRGGCTATFAGGYVAFLDGEHVCCRALRA